MKCPMCNTTIADMFRICAACGRAAALRGAEAPDLSVGVLKLLVQPSTGMVLARCLDIAMMRSGYEVLAEIGRDDIGRRCRTRDCEGQRLTAVRRLPGGVAMREVWAEAVPEPRRWRRSKRPRRATSRARVSAIGEHMRERARNVEGHRR